MKHIILATLILCYPLPVLADYVFNPQERTVAVFRRGRLVKKCYVDNATPCLSIMSDYENEKLSAELSVLIEQIESDTAAIQAETDRIKEETSWIRRCTDSLPAHSLEEYSYCQRRRSR